MSIGANFSASIGTEFDCKIYASTAFKSIFITKFHIAAYKSTGYIAPNKYAARSKIGKFREAAAIKLFCALLLQRNQTAYQV